jgi:heme A synthase
MMIIPLIALLLLIFSFFAKVPGGVKWAGVVLGLVVMQVTLGLLGHSIPALGAMHGLNALLLFSAAIHTARRASRVAVTPAAESPELLATPV